MVEAICWLQRDLFFAEGQREWVINQGLISDEYKQGIIDDFVNSHTLDDHFHENLWKEVLNYGRDFVHSRFGTGQVEPVQIEVEVILFFTTGGTSSLLKASNALKAIVKRSADRLAKRALVKGTDDIVGTYTTTIKWGTKTVEARPFGNGYWGKRLPQSNPRVDAYELKINPNNESYYLSLREERMVQFENISKEALQDGKLIMEKSSIYHVYDKPPVLRTNILNEAKDQAAVAKKYGLKVEWLVSDKKAVDHLTRFFKEENVEIIVKLFTE